MTPKGILTKMFVRVCFFNYMGPLKETESFEGYGYKSCYIQHETQLKCAL